MNIAFNKSLDDFLHKKTTAENDGNQKIIFNTFSYLMQEMYHYARRASSNNSEKCEAILVDIGLRAGAKMWEMFILRERLIGSGSAKVDTRIKYSKNPNNEKDICALLTCICEEFWPMFFNRTAKLLKLKNSTNMFIIQEDTQPITDVFASTSGQQVLTSSMYIVGILQAIFDCVGIDANVCYSVNMGRTPKEPSFYNFIVKFTRSMVSADGN